MRQKQNKTALLIWTVPHRPYPLGSNSGAERADWRCVPNGIYHPPKGTSEWKQSWPPYWMVVPNRRAQNWPLQRALRNEGFRRVQLMDTSGSHDPLRRFFAWWRRLRVSTGWWRRRALQETVVWSPTPFNPSKLSFRMVNPLKGLGHRDEPFRMVRRVEQMFTHRSRNH